ncbi:MAG: ATP synthase F1 subunit delta [Bacteroidetes bacterium 4572_77]|nr:MAG: ATP synthase F1 subunit delta [Bacteroidetes bacterium 4572_77]
MKQSRLANRYAKALFELALEQKNLNQVGEDMLFIANTIAQNSDLEQMLKSPIIKLQIKETVLRKLFGEQTDPLSLKFMLLVAKKSREEYLAYFAKEFTEIYKDYQGIVDAWVSSASAIEEEVKENLLMVLKKFSGKKIDLHQEVNSDLLGGFVVRIGDYQYDASTKTLIRRLRTDFSKNLLVADL